MLEDYIAKKEVDTEIQNEIKTEDSNLDTDSHLMDDRTQEEVKKAEEDVDLYNIKNFSL